METTEHKEKIMEHTRDRGVAKKKEPKVPTPPVKKSVTIKYGDVLVSVEGETQEQTKKDALEIFGFLEDKYSKHWAQKACSEKTKYE